MKTDRQAARTAPAANRFGLCIPALTALTVSIAGCFSDASQNAGTSDAAVNQLAQTGQATGLFPTALTADDSSATTLTAAANTSTGPDRYTLANQCWVMRQADGQYVTGVSAGQVLAGNRTKALPLYLKPAALGEYLLYTPDQRFVMLEVAGASAAASAQPGLQTVGAQVGGVGSATDIVNPLTSVGDAITAVGSQFGATGAQVTRAFGQQGTLTISAAVNDGAIWRIDQRNGGFLLTNGLTGQNLTPAAQGNNPQTVGGFSFEPASGCGNFPEAELNATGEPFKGKLPNGEVFGWAETHMHLGGSIALGGRLGYGLPFHKFGVTHALEDCAVNHGPNGVLDALDTVVNPQKMLPPHETKGWPTFNAWPSYGSQTHHQTYYQWIKRAHMSGLRLMMQHLVANEMICNIWPYKKSDCNEMVSAREQLKLVRALENYIDAQEGGPGKGFFRIVTDPFEARRVIEKGQMAVVLGIELEKPFDCGEYLDQPECTPQQIDARMKEWWDLGLRAVFPIHIFDNAIGGAEFSRFSVPLIQLYNAGNIVESGHPYATISCDEADAVGPGEAVVDRPGIMDTVLKIFRNPAPLPTDGCKQNARGLTPTGEYFINRLIDLGMIIELDHSGPRARKRMLDISKERGGIPMVSGHTGSVTKGRDSARILETGGIISNLTDEPAPVTIAFIQDLEKAYKGVFGSTKGFATGFGSDINGIHQQSAPRQDAATNPLKYPFTSFDGKVSFGKQVTGQRVFDLNKDGVAHYGLYADYIADIQRTPGGQDALKHVFRSAEAYLQAWEKVYRARTEAK